jgi:hypothetical protein
MHENFKKKTLYLWCKIIHFARMLLFKMATIYILIVHKVLDFFFPLFITALTACLIFPQGFEDFIKFFFLLFRDYKFYIFLVFTIHFLCMLIKEIEKKKSSPVLL